MPIYSRDDYMPIPTDIPKYDQFANPIDSNFYIKELENKTNGIYLPEKIHNYSNFEYDEETTIMLLKDIAKIAENIELMDTKSIINYYSSFISQETKNQNKISDEILSSEYLPNVSEDLLVPITSIINNIKNVIYTTYLIDSSLNDITIQFDGKLYFILAQYAYTTYDEYEKMSLEERNWLKDGGVLFDPNNPYVFSSDNWDIARSSCSACATFNAVFNLLTPSEIIEFLSENKNLYANTINNNSLNAGILLGINELLKDGDFDDNYLINNRYLVSKEIVSKYFSNDLTSNIVDKTNYLNDNIVLSEDSNIAITREELYNNISDHNMTMVVRLKANDGRYQSDYGHYVAVIDYKVENGEKMVFVADSAITIPERTAESISGNATNRTGWVSLNEFESYLRSDDTFTIISKINGGKNG